MHILFFDIDGTLIRCGGAGKAAMEAALAEAFDIQEIHDTVAYSGRTDRAIGRDLLIEHGLEPSEAHRRRLTEAYLRHLPRTLAEKTGMILPGVAALLQALGQREDVSLGLLTGNIQAGARSKLSHFGLWEHFRFGGFGEIHEERNRVAHDALSAAEAYLCQAVDPARVWVIGDTPLDVACARAIGAKVVAVTTGWHTRAELVSSGPDLVLESLAAAEGWLHRLA